MRVRVLARRARRSDGADAGLVELGRVGILAVFLVDEGRAGILGLGGRGRGVGLYKGEEVEEGGTSKERSEREKKREEVETEAEKGKKTTHVLPFSLYLTFFSAFFLAVSMALSLRLNSLFCRDYCGRNNEIEKGERKEKELGAERSHFNRFRSRRLGRIGALSNTPLSPSNYSLLSVLLPSGPLRRQAYDRKRKKTFQNITFLCFVVDGCSSPFGRRKKKNKRNPHVLLIFSPFSSTVSSVHLSGRT